MCTVQAKRRYDILSLTFVLVRLGLYAEDGDNSYDDDNGCGGKRHHKPRLPVEGLGLRVPVLQVHLRRSRDLEEF